MIIKGKSRGRPRELGKYLSAEGKNERVTLLDVFGTVAQDVPGAILEMEARSLGTRCTKPLYHFYINPEPPYRLTMEQVKESIQATKEKLGLEGHAHVAVMHERLGRQHIHVVVDRIDLNRMAAVSDSHNYRKHEEVARDLERRFGHPHVQGVHHAREGVERPDRTPSRAELRQEERTGIRGKDVKTIVTALFRSADNAHAFKAALEETGYILAQGDRRDFVIVDRKGGIHSLARRIDGIKAAQLREFMAPIDRAALPTIEEVKLLQQWKRAAHAQAKLETKYSRAEDYVSQTQAALKDHIARQKKLDANANRDSVWEHLERSEKKREKGPADKRDQKTKDEVRIERILEEQRDDRRRDRDASESRRATRTKAGPDFGNVEMTEGLQRRVERFLQDGGDRQTSVDRTDWGPDRQREAPGGGRSRGR